MKHSRRSFLSHSLAVTSGFAGLEKCLGSQPGAELGSHSPYGPLIRDPRSVMDLPRGFSYQIISMTGDRMTDGYKVPGQPDGMGAFQLDQSRVAVVRNHEIGHSYWSLGPFEDNRKLPEGFNPELSFDPGRHGAQPFVGGTTTIIFNTAKQEVEKQFLSLIGTDRNCAGGVTPWNTWVTCEEPGDLVSQWGTYHGYALEVPVTEEPRLARPIALRDMGRFRHEAIAVDPDTGFVYETEDRGDSAIYRFLPNVRTDLASGGKLQALMIKGRPGCDTRNFGTAEPFPVEERFAVEWIDLEDVDSPKDDLRHRAVEQGAAIFTRGEGMWFGSAKEVGEKTIYWACTDGGSKFQGQIFRYFPDSGEMDLYLEPNDSNLLRNADNLTVAPGSGHLYICEDTSGTCHVRGVTGEGELFTFARNAEWFDGKQGKSEVAGVCFSPDGSTMFLNIQSPGTTLAITGPFAGTSFV